MSKKCACGREMVLKSWKHVWACTRCGRTKPEEEIPTNADHIRAMDDEELADFLVGIADDGNLLIREWLKKPYKEET